MSNAENTASNLMNISWIPLFGWMGLMFYMKSQRQRAVEEQGGVPENSGDFDPVLKWLEGTPIEKIWKWMFGAYLGLSIYASIVLAQSTQTAFSMTDRNAIGATSAFLSPLESIFQFLEDTVTVQINYSLAAGTKDKTKEIFWTAMRSAVLSGIAASLMCTVAGKAHDSLSALVAPGSTHDHSLYPGCVLLDDAKTVADTARPYFLLYAWRFPFTFVNLVVTGLLYGAKQINLMGAIFVLGELALLLTWYWVPSESDRHDNTTLLGLAYLLQVVVVAVAAISSLYFLKPVQEFTGVDFKLAAPKATTLQGRFAEKDAEPARRPHLLGLSKLQSELMRDGAKVLAMDLCLQLSATITFYVALMHSAPTAYQLTALGNALPEYGLAYVLGIRFISKIVGAQLLSRKAYVAFKKFAMMALVATTLICCVSVGIVVAYRESIAYDYGYNACEFAGSSECFPIYESVFGGEDSLQSNFRVFAAVVVVDSLFNVCRGLVLACLDFDFIGKAAIAAFFLIYIPAILIAWGVGITARGLYIAQNAPMFVLMVGHVWRLHSNITKMSAGDDGPWSKGESPEGAVATEGVHRVQSDDALESLPVAATEPLLRDESNNDTYA